MTVFSMEDWEKTTVEEVKMRWGNRRREIEDKIEIRKKKKSDQREKVFCLWNIWAYGP